MPHPTPNRLHFSDEYLRRIIAKQLPAWKRACAASDSNAIVLHESAFGRSHSELLLLACAIKYAALAKKTVHIACDDAVQGNAPPPKAPSIRVFRERNRRALASSRPKNMPGR